MIKKYTLKTTLGKTRRLKVCLFATYTFSRPILLVFYFWISLRQVKSCQTGTYVVFGVDANADTGLVVSF